MTTIEDRHRPVELSNGCVVCACGAGNDPESLPFYGTDNPGLIGQLRSRDAFGDHLAGLLTLPEYRA